MFIRRYVCIMEPCAASQEGHAALGINVSHNSLSPCKMFKAQDAPNVEIIGGNRIALHILRGDW